MLCAAITTELDLILVVLRRYFAIQTRGAELIEERLLLAERVPARKKLTLSISRVA
jgi:hypothetical protein